MCAVFRPRLLSNCRQERHLCYVWGGRTISTIDEKRDAGCSRNSVRGCFHFGSSDPDAGFETNRIPRSTKSMTWEERELAASTSPSAITQNCEQLRWSPLHPAGADKIRAVTCSYKLSLVRGHPRRFALKSAHLQNSDAATPRFVTKCRISGTPKKSS